MDIPTTTTPFRADHVGSLLRPPALAEARRRHADDEISDADLRAVENDLIADAVRKQEEIGLSAATDGEFRRSYWHYDFLGGLAGLEYRTVEPTPGGTSGFKHEHQLEVVGPIGWQDHPFVEDFRFVASQTRSARPKQTIPSPSVLHFRFAHLAREAGLYPDEDRLLDDLEKTYRNAVAAFADVGCRYLQFDEVNIAMLCDPKQVEQAKERRIYRDDLASVYIGLINAAVAERPADMLVSTHLCRGNFRSSWIASGGYEPVAEALFSELDVDAYFLEFDSDRAGSFEPLRFVPKGNKKVVLGLITSKSGELEPKDRIKRRVEEATRYVALDQLSLGPQCGFASTEEGNRLTPEQQWSKLELCVELTREIWG